MVLCLYKNCFDEICSWLFDTNSKESRVNQWAKTFRVHDSVNSLVDRINHVDVKSVVEAEV